MKDMPAFPTVGAGAGDQCGMTLRDYFAAKAMPSILDNYTLQLVSDDDFLRSAKRAYKMASAMLKAREGVK